MLEAFKGLNILDPKFYIPVLIGVVALFIIITVAKKLLKFAIVVAVIGLALLVYFNMPSVKLDGTNAIINVKGHEYVIDSKDVKISPETIDGKTRVFLVSEGKKVVELPFSKDFAERFILDKLKGNVK